MSDIEASTQAENPSEQVDASQLSEHAKQAFDPHASTPLNAQKERMAAWEAAQAEVGEFDPDEPLLPAKVAPATKPKAAKKAESLEVEEPAAEDETEAAADEAEEEEEAPKPVGKKKPEKLSQAESRALIEQRVELNKRFQRRDQQWTAKVQAYEAQLQAKAAELEPIQKAVQLFEAGDLNGFAECLGAITKDPSIKDWTTLNEAAIAAVANPVYKRMRELERSNAEVRKQREAEIEAHKAYQAEQARLAEVQSWKQSLADEAIADEDPAVGDLLTARPNMVDALFSIQQQHYHASGGDLLPARDAAIKLLENVAEDFKFWKQYASEHPDFELFAELLGDQAPTPVKSKTDRAARVLERQTGKKLTGGATPPKVAPKPNVAKAVKNISQAQTTAASAVGYKTSEQLKKEFEQRIQNDWRNTA